MKNSDWNKVRVEVVEWLENGKNVASYCKQSKYNVKESEIYRKRREDAKFRDELATAYESYFMHLVSELDELSSNPDCDMLKGIRDQREKFDLRRSRMDMLKFTLAKLAPIFAAMFVPKQPEVASSAPQIMIMNYSTQEDAYNAVKLVKDAVAPSKAIGNKGHED